jgi:hypothetical protein
MSFEPIGFRRHFDVSLLLALTVCVHTAETAGPRRWQPVRDDVFVQEVGHQILTTEPLHTVAIHEGQIFAGSAKGTVRLEDGKLVDDGTMKESGQRLISAGGRLWAITAPGLHRRDMGGWKKLSTEAVTDVCVHGREILTAAGKKL